MLLFRALSRGLFGGYLVLMLLLGAGTMTRIDNPAAALTFLEGARWLPGAMRMEATLRDAYGLSQPEPQIASISESARQQAAPVTASDTVPEAAPAPEATTTSELSPLQRLRQRTFGNASQTTLARR